MAEVIRLLQNLTASVSALIDHSWCLYRHMYQGSHQFPEYEEAVTTKISTDEVIQFVQGITNCCLHHATGGIGTTMTIVDMQNEMFEKKVTVVTADLLDFAWNDAAMRFIKHAPQSIDLRQTLRDYHNSIQAFCDWFSQRTRVLNATDLPGGQRLPLSCPRLRLIAQARNYSMLTMCTTLLMMSV